MNTTTRQFSLALASAFALVLVGCGQSSGPGLNPGPGPVTPPVQATLPEPKAQMNLFRPKTEAELRGVYGGGDYAGLPMANYGYLIARTKPSFDPAAFGKYGLEVVSSLSANGARYYYLHKESDLIETMKKVDRLDGVMYIEPDTMSYTTAGFEYKPGDTLVNSQRQFGVLTTMTKKAWETYGFGPNRPVVADFDTGIRWSHEDFIDPDREGEDKRVIRHAFSWYNTAATSALLTDLGLTPLSDPNPPDRMVTDPALAQGTDGASSSHGTHTAGTIAAVGNNDKGVAGVCWNVDLISYKVLSNAGSGGNWAVYGSFWHLVKWKNELVDENGAPSPNGTPRYPHTIPVNLSLGGGVLGQFNADMVEMALEHDIVLCAASGNDDAAFASWPGSLSGVIRVGAVNVQDRRVYFSNWGPDMSVMAPGNDVVSTFNTGNANYSDMGGTSMACPHVTGLVAYMLTFNPDLKADQIKTYLERNADPIDGQKGFDPRYGYGRINTYRTIGAVLDDMNAGRGPASDYVMSPVKVTVKTDSGVLIDNALVYLYNCNSTGTISNYAGVSMTGMSYVDVRDNLTAEPETGVARFNLLRPGYYKASASFAYYDYDSGEDVTIAGYSPTFEVRAGQTLPPQAVTLGTGTMLVIQTMATANAARAGTDIVYQLFDSATGEAVYEYDYDLFDTAVMTMLPAGTYYLRVFPYNSSSYGEYALWLGTSLRQASDATGTFAEPGDGGIVSTRAENRANAQTIELGGELVYGDLVNTTGHFYRFVIE